MKYTIPILFALSLFLGKGSDCFWDKWAPLRYQKTLERAPEFYVLEWKEGASLSPKTSDMYIEVDTLGNQEILVLSDKRDNPVLYTSEIVTPVCADGECKMMNIQLYWTLLGEYAGFDRYPELPLTKHDHDEFGKEDYLKLHDLLKDDKSILGRRSINQLVEKPTMRTVNGVDALSGATIAEVKESVVSGALYSCYTAWHLVHGKIDKKLKKHTLGILNETMLMDMLYSKNPDYQLFALEKLNVSQYEDHYLQIATIFKTGIPLVRSIIAKELPSKFKSSPELEKPFWDAFGVIDLGSRSLLLKHLEDAPQFAVLTVSDKLSALSKNQLKRFLEYISQQDLTPEVQSNMEAFANSDNETYGYLVQEFLSNHN
ncbi:MAG: hypothetical protein AB3N14_07020 [Flavobacteriaceae bacterium]